MKLPKYTTQAIIKSMVFIYLRFIILYALASPSYASIENELNQY